MGGNGENIEHYSRVPFQVMPIQLLNQDHRSQISLLSLN